MSNLKLEQSVVGILSWRCQVMATTALVALSNLLCLVAKIQIWSQLWMMLHSCYNQTPYPYFYTGQNALALGTFQLKHTHSKWNPSPQPSTQECEFQKGLAWYNGWSTPIMKSTLPQWETKPFISCELTGMYMIHTLQSYGWLQNTTMQFWYQEDASRRRVFISSIRGVWFCTWNTSIKMVC